MVAIHHPGYRKQGFVVAILIVLIAFMSGCQPKQVERERPRESIQLETEIDPTALQGALSRYYDDVLTGVIGVASDMAAKTKERRIREETLRLKIRVLKIIRLITMEPDPRQQYLATWILIVQARYHMTEGKGSKIYGEQQHLILDLLNELEEKILNIGIGQFTEESITAAKDDVEKLAHRQAMTAILFEDNYHTGAPSKQKSEGDLGAIVGIPMSPVSGLQGIGDTPAAIGQFTLVADRFATIVYDSPEMTRWQLELLLLDIENSPVVTKLMTDIDKFEKSIDTIAKTVEKLPEDIRVQLDSTLSDLDEMQPRLQQTLADTQLALEQTERVVKSIDTTAKSLTMTADSIDEAAGTISLIISDIKSMKGPPNPDKKPFDINKYVMISENVNQSVGELRETLAELNKSISQGGQLGQIGPGIRGLINTLTWRAILLIVVFFGVAYGYRRLTLRLTG